MVHHNKRKKTPTQRLSPQSGIGHHAHGAPDNPNNKDQETPFDKDNPKDGINPNPTSSQLTTENIVNEPNQLIEERMVMGLPPTPWVEEQHSSVGHDVPRAHPASLDGDPGQICVAERYPDQIEHLTGRLDRTITRLKIM